MLVMHLAEMVVRPLILKRVTEVMVKVVIGILGGAHVEEDVLLFLPLRDKDFIMGIKN